MNSIIVHAHIEQNDSCGESGRRS